MGSPEGKEEDHPVHEAQTEESRREKKLYEISSLRLSGVETDDAGVRRLHRKPSQEPRNAREEESEEIESMITTERLNTITGI